MAPNIPGAAAGLPGSPLRLAGRDGWLQGGSGHTLTLLWDKEKFREFPFCQVSMSNSLLSFSFREFAIKVACFCVINEH